MIIKVNKKNRMNNIAYIRFTDLIQICEMSNMYDIFKPNICFGKDLDN